MRIAPVRDYLLGLQDSIVSTLEKLDGGRFTRDEWKRPGGGGGVSRILEEGKLFERAGVGFSHVSGTRLPPSASAHRPGIAGRAWGAMGVSLVLHPRNVACEAHRYQGLRRQLLGSTSITTEALRNHRRRDNLPEWRSKRGSSTKTACTLR